MSEANKRAAFEAWYANFAVESWDLKSCCSDAFEAGRKSVLDRMPSEDEMFQAAQREDVSVCAFKAGVRWLSDALTSDT